jgi:hypothetical protein
LAEFDLDELRNLKDEEKVDEASKLAMLLPAKPGQPQNCVVDAAEFLQLTDSLRRAGLVKELARPRIAAVVNRWGESSDGATQVELMLASVGAEVRFDVRIRHASPFDPPSGSVVSAGTTIRPLRVREIEASSSLTAGQGLVLKGLTQTRWDRDKQGHDVARTISLVGFVCFEPLPGPAGLLPPTARAPRIAPPQ